MTTGVTNLLNEKQFRMEQTGNTSVSDLALIKEIADENKYAFKVLYNKYVKQIHSYIYKLTNDSKLSEEVTNDVFFEVWNSAEKFQGKSKVLTWIFGIAHNKTINELRKKKEISVDPEELMNVVSKDMETEELMMKKDREKQIKSALDQLSPEHRTVVELTFLQGLSYKEIAVIMDCPVNTVKTRMHYAKEKLKETLTKLKITAGGF